MTGGEVGLDERGRWRCSIAARARGDQRVGTAVPAPRWFLVGHPGPWERTALGTGPVSGVADELSRVLGAAGARLQLVRRHGRRPDVDTDEQPVFLVDSIAGTVARGTWREPADLLRLAARLGDPDPTDLEPHPEPLVLVCAHGRKDKCCAIEGRVVAAVLDDVLPGAVWETTHLGGDRFAGNIAYLPEGSMYGGLDGGTAARVVLSHVDGEVDLDHWRGRSVWSAPTQVAVAAVLRDEGGRLPDVGRVRAAESAPETWRVTVELAGVTHAREVTRRMTAPERLTCQVEAKPAAVYAVSRG